MLCATPFCNSGCLTNQPRKEMFYLMTHSTHFIYGYMVRHMVKDHSDSGIENLLPPHRLLFPINSKSSFICTIPHRIAHTTAFVTQVVEHWQEQEIAQWVHHEGSIRRPSAKASQSANLWQVKINPKCLFTNLFYLFVCLCIYLF